MKASETTLLGLLRKSQQLTIPIYQRTYAWKAQHCQQFWNDIIRSGIESTTHFIGSVVYIDREFSQISRQSHIVIDGQQRLTTVFLILEALARHLNGKGEVIDSFSTNKIRAYYLLNEPEEDKRRYKLLLTETDEQSLISLLDQKEYPEIGSIAIKQNFEFFQDKINDLTSEEIGFLCKGLSKLIAIDTALDPRQDNPQLIFESMNSTGKALSQADLIRNFILMLNPDNQDNLYTDHWRPMEKQFGQENYNKYFDGFMRHYLTTHTGKIPREKEVYDAFKSYARGFDADDEGVEKITANIKKFAGYYCNIAFDKEEDDNLRAEFRSLCRLEMDIAYPLLLKVYSDYRDDKISKHDFISIIQLIETYIFRRAVCAIPTNSLNNTLLALIKAIDESDYLKSVQSYFAILPTYRRFPDDDEFSRELKTRRLYGFGYRKYFFDRLENHDTKEVANTNEYSIEHIMPQNENLSEEWKKELGENWAQIRIDWLHTLGNLTLTGYNSKYSDHPFVTKRDMENGFKHSPLRLNQSLKEVEKWNEDEIKKRADNLANIALKVWPDIGIPRETTEQKVKKTAGGLSYEDHQYLLGDIRLLFDAFRKDVLALDSNVTEEIFKPYIAFKAETNFVDVIPRAKCLKLTLNLDFHELRDPKGKAKDVTEIGHLGNGNVEVTLEKEEDIPYAVGLVSQAFEKQIQSTEPLV